MTKKSFNSDAEWLEFRTKYVTASEIASVFGLSKYKSANQLLNEKRTGKRMDEMSAINSRRGKILEAAAAETLRLAGRKVIRNTQNDITFIEEYKLAATLDAMEDGNPVELKSSSIRKFDKEWRVGNAPVEYLCQGYVQSMVTKGSTEAKLVCICIREVEPSQVKGYKGIYPVVDVSIAEYVIKRSKHLDNLFIEHLNTFVYEIDEDSTMYRVSKKTSQKILDLLLKQTTFIGVEEVAEYKAKSSGGDDIY